MMIIIGHRGAKGLAPENTMAALLKGIEHGADELEFDVRVTSDNIPVLAHDPDIHDSSGAALSIADHTYFQLLARHSGLTSFESVFNKVGTRAALYIEIKHGAHLSPIIKVLQDQFVAGYPPQNVRLASFEIAILSHLHKLFPEVTMVVLERWSGVRATHRARKLHTKRIAMNHTWLWSGFIKSISAGGYQLTPYTVNDPELIKRWEKYGLYGVVTDYPDLYQSKVAS